MFTALTIPTYLVWDGDKDDPGAKPETNQSLLRLVHAPDEAWPPTRVAASFAVFERDLAATVRDEVGAAAYDAQAVAVIDECGMSKKRDAFKSPLVVETLVRRLHDMGLRSPTIEPLADPVVPLRRQQ